MYGSVERNELYQIVFEHDFPAKLILRSVYLVCNTTWIITAICIKSVMIMLYHYEEKTIKTDLKDRFN